MTSEDVIPLQVRKLGQQIVSRVPARQVFQNGLYRIAQAAHAWLPVTNPGIDRNAGKQVLV